MNLNYSNNNPGNYFSASSLQNVNLHSEQLLKKIYMVKKYE